MKKEKVIKSLKNVAVTTVKVAVIATGFIYAPVITGAFCVVKALDK